MDSSHDSKVTDKRFAKLETVLAKDYIPFLQGRPVRDMSITRDDLMNLKIALYGSASFEEFLTKV